MTFFKNIFQKFGTYNVCSNALKAASINIMFMFTVPEHRKRHRFVEQEGQKCGRKYREGKQLRRNQREK
jgi:hypothetical protein